MITRPTTFVFGAGTSMPYGFPSGPRLLELVKERIPYRVIGEPAERILRAGFRLEFAQQLRSELEGALVDSIDSYLETHPSLEPLGKFLIADVLVECENANYMYNIKETKQNIYHYLYKLMHAPSLEEFKKNTVRIVTFNYDRSFEFVFANAIRTRYPNCSFEQAMDALPPIVHVYGSLGTLSAGPDMRGFVPDRSVDIVLEASKRIHLIPSQRSQSEKEIATMFQGSMQVVFLGFSYQPENMLRLNVRDNIKDKDVYGCVYDLQLGEMQTAASYLPNPHAFVHGGTADDSVMFLRKKMSGGLWYFPAS